MFRKFSIAALTLAILPFATAHAQVSVGVQIGGPYARPYYRPYHHHYYYYRPGVYVAPVPVVVQPAPVVVVPAQVVQPVPVPGPAPAVATYPPVQATPVAPPPGN